MKAIRKMKSVYHEGNKENEGYYHEDNKENEGYYHEGVKVP
jgi:hypothetical protein